MVLIYLRMINELLHRIAASRNLYDENEQRNSEKLPIGISEKRSRPIVAVESTSKPREYTGENVVHLRRLHWAPGMSLYRGYFVPSGIDPSGRACVKCKIGSRGCNITYKWIEVDCQGLADTCCKKLAEESDPGPWRESFYTPGNWKRCKAKPDENCCEFGYWDYVTAWENPTPCDPVIHKCKWVSLGVGAGAACAAAAGPEVTILAGGNVFKIISRRFKCGFRIDPAHHGKPWGHSHFWHWW